MLHASRDAGARCAREDSLDDRNLIADFSSYEHREAHKNLEYIPCLKRQLRLKSNAIPATAAWGPPARRPLTSFEGDPQRACGIPRTFPLVVFWRSGRAAPRAREAPEWAVLPTPRAQLLAEPKSVRGYTTHERARGLAPPFAQVFSLLPLCSSVAAPPAARVLPLFPTTRLSGPFSHLARGISRACRPAHPLYLKDVHRTICVQTPWARSWYPS